MFSRSNNDNDITTESMLKEIRKIYNEKQTNKLSPRSYQRDEQRNILIIGRRRTGKTTLKNVLQDPCYIPDDSTLFSRTPSIILHPLVQISDSNLSLRIVETSYPFERSSTEQNNDEQVWKINQFCTENNITQFHSIFFCTSFESNINNEDVEILHKLVQHFGEQIRSHLCLIITRCELKDNRQCNHLLDELYNDIHFKEVIPYFNERIYFTGSTSQDSYKRRDLNLLVDQFETVYEYRENLIKFIQNTNNVFVIRPEQQTFLPNNERDPERICCSNKIIICFVSILSLLFILFVWWKNNQQNRFEFEEDWIDRLNSGYLSVNHMNRMIIFASESNIELNSTDIENPKWLNNILSEQSNRMLDIVNRLNQINDKIMESLNIWLLSSEKIQSESNRNLIWNNIEELCEKSIQFENFSSNLIEILTSIYRKEKNIEMNSIYLCEEVNKEIKEERFTLNSLKIAEEHYDQMLVLYKNHQQTEEKMKQSLRNVNEARQKHNQVFLSLQTLREKNQTLQFEEIKREQHLKLMFIIIEEMHQLHKNWSHFHEFLSIFSRHIQFIQKLFDEQLINSMQHLCQTLNISLKFMIEQLDMNKNYFLLETNQDRSDHLSQLNLQKMNRTQLISSSSRSKLLNMTSK
ncbi:hypothetical protein I4U23_016079 [Adineta vaga]|nr:hypothetical protein I4U23_016079 [Adineta vaga]